METIIYLGICPRCGGNYVVVREKMKNDEQISERIYEGFNGFLFLCKKRLKTLECPCCGDTLKI